MTFPIRDYFPLGKAYDKAFCNRVKETEWLKENALCAKHSLLVAPRRYGKSSLAERALTLAQLPYVRVNFHLCTTEQEVATLIIDNTIELIGRAVGSIEKLVNKVKKYATNFTPKLSFGDDIVKLELEPHSAANYAVNIAEALLLLEKLLQEKKQYAVLFLDEFQEITRLKKHAALEGAIRTAAQEMCYCSIIFSGSIRSLLLSMFNHESRPLYKLCRKLHLTRISATDYKRHLNKISKKAWKENLDDDVFEEIMRLSDRHPYYVNYLCDVLWQGYKNKKAPNVGDVGEAWKTVAQEEYRDVIKEIIELPLGHKRILKYIANETGKNLTSQTVATDMVMAASSISSALSSLVEKDLLENEDGCYRLINPVLRTILRERLG